MTQIILKCISWTVIHSIWQGVLIALLAGIFSLHKPITRSSTSKFKVFTGALIALVITSLFTFIYEYYQYSLSVSDTATGVFSDSGMDPLATQEIVYSHDGPSHLEDNALINYFNQHLPLIAMIWFVGLFLAILRLIGGLSYIQYLRSHMNFVTDEYWGEKLDQMIKRLHINRPVAVLESALVRSPLTIGHAKPLILFPIGIINKLETSDVEAILAHELAHIMRHDYLINVLIVIVESLYYYHPAVWWLTSQAKFERESACDDMAVEICGDKRAYAKSLVVVQEMALTPSYLALNIGGQKSKGELMKRVLRLLPSKSGQVDLNERTTSISILTALLLVCSVIVLPSFREIVATRASTEIYKEGEGIYLTYFGPNGLDSLAVPYCVSNGNYTYDEANYHLDFTVENNQVLSFSINGVAVKPQDIPAFKEMIYAAIDQIVDEGDPICQSELLNKSLFEKMDQMGYGADFYILLINKNESVINGEFLDWASHHELLEMVESYIGAPLEGAMYYKLTNPPLIDKSTPGIPMPPATPDVKYDFGDDIDLSHDSEPGDEEFSFGLDGSHEAVDYDQRVDVFQMELEAYLIQHKLISRKNYSYSVSLDEIRIDAKVASRKVTTDIMNIFESIFDEPMNSSFTSVKVNIQE